jgi:hypothetical protein
MSGGRMEMPIWRELKIYSATFPGLSMQEVIRAAMNSTG